MGSRKRKKMKSRGQVRKPTPSKRRSSFEFGALYRLAQILLGGLLLYITASLFAIGTGVLGENVASYILRIAGGGFMLILLHFFYGLLCSLFNRQINSVCAQWLGTLCLYGAICLFLGMLKNSGLVREIGLLSPGIIGNVAMAILPKFVGVVGTVLAGFAMLFFSAFYYGYLSAERVALLHGFSSKFKLPKIKLPELPSFSLNKGQEVDEKTEVENADEPEFSQLEENSAFEELSAADLNDQDAETIEDDGYSESVKVEDTEVQTDDGLDIAADENADEVSSEEVQNDNLDEKAEEETLNVVEEEKQPVHSCLKLSSRITAMFTTALNALVGSGTGKHGAKSTPRHSADHKLYQEEDNISEDTSLLVEEQLPDEKPAGVTSEEEDDFETPQELQETETVHNDMEEEHSSEDELDDDCDPFLPPPEQEDFDETSGVNKIESSRRRGLPQQRFSSVSHVSDTKAETIKQPASMSSVAAPITKKPKVEVEKAQELKGTEGQPSYCEKVVPPGSFPPPLDLLGPHQEIKEVIDDQQARSNGQAVIASLANFGVTAELKRTIIGPTVVQYQIQLAPGIKVRKVYSLSNDIAVALGVSSIRVEAPIPGTSYIGIELPNANRRAVPLRQILESKVFQETKLKLPLPLGQTVDGRILIAGLEELPHLLIAGTTGSGKSIFVNNCIVAMCYHNTPQQLRFIMVDPKRVEMGIYESLPHILAKPIMTANSAVHALGWAVREMERRYDVCSQAKVRNISSYNSKVLPKDRLPHIVIVVDELADLMMTAQKEVEDYIMRLAQMARAVGIHLMLATQRPSVNVLTGTIKANVPARVSFSLPTVVDSRTIIDRPGAQNLLGKGDMLFVSTKTPHPLRIQSPFIDEQTNIRVVEYLRNTFGDPDYIDLEDQDDEGVRSGNSKFVEDERLEEAIEIVLHTGIASTSGLQRRMKVGFTRAGNMIDTMEMMGIIGPKNGAKPREILVDESEAWAILEQCRNE